MTPIKLYAFIASIALAPLVFGVGNPILAALWAAMVLSGLLAVIGWHLIAHGVRNLRR